MVDVSRNTVLVLLVLTVVISIIGTYSLLVGVDDVMRDKLSNPTASSEAKISIQSSDINDANGVAGDVVKEEEESSYARFGLKRGA